MANSYTLGTRGFSRVRREFSALAEGRRIFGAVFSSLQNIRFSSLFAAGDVSRGGTSATQRKKFPTDAQGGGGGGGGCSGFQVTGMIEGCFGFEIFDSGIFLGTQIWLE